jgi:hypothetical protein
MSYIRATCRRRFSIGTCGLYVYNTYLKRGRAIIQYIDGVSGEAEEYVEIMFRVLERSGIPVSLEMVNAVRFELSLKPLKSIVSLEDYNRDYECPGCSICKRKRKK